MKKIISVILMASSLVGCNDFLDTVNYSEFDTSNFPATSDDVYDLVIGAYSTQTADIKYTIKSHPYYVAEAASDERLGGCEYSDFDLQGIDKIMTYDVNANISFWQSRYKGVYRANMIIESIDQCDGFESEAAKDHMLGEAYFLRALFYWELAQTFENIPMPLYTTDYDLNQVSVDDLYAQIGSDFIKSIELLERNKYDVNVSGVATTWAAQGFLGRVFLFYTGFYEKSEMPLNDGESLTSSEMATYLEDCINNSGHGLVSDFRNLWAYTNEYTGAHWDYCIDNNLKWEGENNKEFMYNYKFGMLASSSTDFRNFFYLWQGNLGTTLDREDTYPYTQGYAMGSVCPSLWDDWAAAEPDDIRRVASIVNVAEELPQVVGAASSSWEVTLFKAKKFFPTSSWSDDTMTTLYQIFTYQMYGASNSYSKGLVMDFPLMRFAEILLMHSEITQTADGMNTVRARAGLDPTTYSLDNLKAERRWELSFEGLRWNDTRRWHTAEDLLDNQIGVEVTNNGAATVMPSLGGGYSYRYKLTRGFLMIPQTEIDLSNGIIKQNDGWNDGDNYLYTGWS